MARYDVIDLVSGRLNPIRGLPYGFIDAVRAEPSGKFVAAIRPDSGGMSESLWEIDKSGAATLRGRYSPPPSPTLHPFPAQLEPGGALLQFGHGPGVFEDVIVRRTIDGRAEVVYSEAWGPLVKIHISGLITGP